MKLTKCNDSTENLPWQAAMRFSMVVMSSLLFGMHYGQSLPPEIGEVCRAFAISGLAFYFSLELVANQRIHQWARVSQQVAEQKLSRRVYSEDKAISYHKSAEPDEQHSGNVESAMDSCADLAVYLGPTAQPVLSA